MKFRKNAAGCFVTFGNGVTEELSYKDFQAMLRRQMMSKTVKV